MLHLEYAIRHKESEPRHILEKIVWEKDREVAAARERVPLEKLKQQVADLPAPRDFSAALRAACRKPAVIADLKRLADAGLTMDSANPTPQLVADFLRLTDAVPKLRLVVDHLPQIEPPADLAELAKRPQVFIKISEVLRKANDKVPMDLGFYKARLDQLTGLFGPERILFGSDWPNSDNWAPYERVFAIVKQYFAGKTPEANAKYFARNSKAAYRWKPRTAAQKTI